MVPTRCQRQTATFALYVCTAPAIRAWTPFHHPSLISIELLFEFGTVAYVVPISTIGGTELEAHQSSELR
jgi:hypothetical protein